MEIRTESEADRARVYAVEAAAFGRTNEAELVDVLRASADPFVSLVAATGGVLVGHIFFSPAEIETTADGRRVAALGPVGVHPEHQGRGIGSALVRAGAERCREFGWPAVFLVGNPAYYGRFGFQLAGPLGFTYGKPAFEPAFQVLELEEGVLAGCSGRVRFHPAFEEAE